MVLGKNSTQPSVHDFFVNPIRNQDIVSNYFSHDEDTDDSYPQENLYKYLNEKAITDMIKLNSEIANFFSKFKISIKINMKILDHLVNNHMKDTRNIAVGIANKLEPHIRCYVNYKALNEATSLHDLAKVIIPEDILNKKGRLEGEELEIMKGHSDLSYEMLKSTDLDKETLNLIKNHHQKHQKKNSSSAEKDLVTDINLQILSMADIYSALREKRSYKAEMTKEQALEIIYEDVKDEKFHYCIYEALCIYADEQEKRVELKQIENFVLN